MIKYRNAIYVAKLEEHREIKPYTIFENTHTIFLDINHFGFNETQRIVSNLKDILDGKCDYEYEWSGMRASFESTIEKTIIKDMAFRAEILEIETSNIYQVLRSRLEFMKSLKEDGILENVKLGFGIIKTNADKHRLRECFYQYVNDETEINFLLLESDLTLNTQDFNSTLKVNKFFLNVESDSKDYPT